MLVLAAWDETERSWHEQKGRSTNEVLFLLRTALVRYVTPEAALSGFLKAFRPGAAVSF